MNKTILIVVIGVIALLGGMLFINNRPGVTKESAVQFDDTQPAQGEVEDNVQTRQDGANDGEILGGTASRYYAFSASAFEQAMASDKIVFLEFYANWCPVCRAEQPDIVDGFNQLDRDDVVGFRANYKDDETDAAEEALAKQLGVTYQHTKVIFKNGQEVHRDGVQWDAQDFLDAIDSVSE
ncbi:MAG: thioredoxin family protein [Candidatus Roizmanbacteria bacterium]|nr:thioredoxin family protein [Candidatus Roizmanbacteria bacterium]